jgi:hypothetical protein
MYTFTKITAKNDRGTPYHWIEILSDQSPRVLALRAYGKVANNFKYMLFNSVSQCQAYHSKWQSDKEVLNATTNKAETLQSAMSAILLSHPGILSSEFLDQAMECFGGVNGVISNEPPFMVSRSIESAKDASSKPLPESYGVW